MDTHPLTREQLDALSPEELATVVRTQCVEYAHEGDWLAAAALATQAPFPLRACGACRLSIVGPLEGVYAIEELDGLRYHVVDVVMAETNARHLLAQVRADQRRVEGW